MRALRQVEVQARGRIEEEKRRFPRSMGRAQIAALFDKFQFSLQDGDEITWIGCQRTATPNGTHPLEAGISLITQSYKSRLGSL